MAQTCSLALEQRIAKEDWASTAHAFNRSQILICEKRSRKEEGIAAESGRAFGSDLLRLLLGDSSRSRGWNFEVLPNVDTHRIKAE